MSDKYDNIDAARERDWVHEEEKDMNRQSEAERLTRDDIDSAEVYASRMLNGTAAGLPGAGAAWVMALATECRALQAKVKQLQEQRDEFERLWDRDHAGEEAWKRLSESRGEEIYRLQAQVEQAVNPQEVYDQARKLSSRVIEMVEHEAKDEMDGGSLGYSLNEIYAMAQDLHDLIRGL